MKHPPSQTLGSFLDDWEAQHGALTPEELARARDEMRPLPLEAGALRQGADEASPPQAINRSTISARKPLTPQTLARRIAREQLRNDLHKAFGMTRESHSTSYLIGWNLFIRLPAAFRRMLI
jgi:hypothetical protein